MSASIMRFGGEMNDFQARQIAELHAQAQENRYQFLKAELLTCFNAIDFGHFEFDRGVREMAEKEVRAVEKGFETILRFLPKIESLQRRDEIEAALPPLREGLTALRNKLGLSHETESGIA